jgi:hypothetical protein
MAFDRFLSSRLDANIVGIRIPLQALVRGKRRTGPHFLGVAKVSRMQGDNERVCVH